MQPIRDLAIVLRSTQYEERHRVVTALTQQYGQVTALARNCIQSRRFGGTLAPFAASEWIFTFRPGTELCHLTEAHIREPFENLCKNFERLSLASALSELMLRLSPRHEACPDLFRLHSNALSTLATLDPLTSPGIEIPLLNAYLAKLLQWSGNQPRLQSCLTCKAPLETFLLETQLSCIIADAGWICPDCRHQGTRHIRDREGQSFEYASMRTTALTLWNFRLSLQTPIRQIPAQIQGSLEEHKSLFKFLEALFIYHIPGFDKKPLKSLRFLDLESNVQPEATNPL